MYDRVTKRKRQCALRDMIQLVVSDVHESKQVVIRDALHCSAQGEADSSFLTELWVAAM